MAKTNAEATGAAMTQGPGKTNVEGTAARTTEAGEVTAGKVAAGMEAVEEAMVITEVEGIPEEVMEAKAMVEEGTEKLSESNGAMALNRNLATLKR
jgi:DNA-binding transcriptional regulator of glucitol operon